jgi:hypothetical protein
VAYPEDGESPVKEVELSVDGVIVAVPTVSPYPYELLLTQAPGTEVIIGARAVDLVGNRGPLRPETLIPTRATRPKNSRLSKRSLDEAGFKRLPSWKDALERYITEICET